MEELSANQVNLSRGHRVARVLRSNLIFIMDALETGGQSIFWTDEQRTQWRNQAYGPDQDVESAEVLEGETRSGQ